MTSDYATQTEIANNRQMRDRLAACLAEYTAIGGRPIPAQDCDKTAIETRREWAATSEWNDYWVNWLAANPDTELLVGNEALEDGQVRGYVESAYPLPEPPV